MSSSWFAAPSCCAESGAGCPNRSIVTNNNNSFISPPYWLLQSHEVRAGFMCAVCRRRCSVVESPVPWQTKVGLWQIPGQTYKSPKFNKSINVNLGDLYVCPRITVSVPEFAISSVVDNVLAEVVLQVIEIAVVLLADVLLEFAVCIPGDVPLDCPGARVSAW